MLVFTVLMVIRAAVLLATGGDNVWYVIQLLAGIATLAVRSYRWYRQPVEA